MAKHPRKRDLWDLATGKYLEVFPVDLREIVKINPGRYSTTPPTQAQFEEYKRNHPEPEKPSPVKDTPLPVRDSPLVSIDKRIAFAESEVDKEPGNPARKAKLASLLYERNGEGDAARATELLASLTAAHAEPDAAEEAAARHEAILGALRKLDPLKDFKEGRPADLRKLKARLGFNPSDEEIDAALAALKAEAAA